LSTRVNDLVDLLRAQRDILRDCLPGKQTVGLIDHSNATGADDSAGRRFQISREQIQESCLSAARWSNNGYKLSTRNSERKIPKHFDRIEHD